MAKTDIRPNGTIIEILTSRKEVIEFVNDYYLDNIGMLGDDFYLYIEYEDGETFEVDNDEIIGKFRKTGIKTMVESNPACYFVYGQYEYEEDEICTVVHAA